METRSVQTIKPHRKKDKWVGLASTATLIVTVILFVTALFEKGLSHDMSLEGAVFLVSLKLILAAYKSDHANQQIQSKLDDLLKRADKVQTNNSNDKSSLC